MSHQPRYLNEVYSIFDEVLLGKGSTGNVYLGCVNGNPARKVAIKTINLHEISNQVTRYLLSCEIAALSNLGKLQNTQHENIVRLLQTIILENHIYLVMQLLEGGTLADYISKHPEGLPEEEALLILRQILQGYQRIKNKQIIHRDIKPGNILFKASPIHSKNIAIIDFGYCEMKEVPNKPKVFYNVGSPKYMSPEAYKQNKYSQKSDIWAIGVILYQMLLGKTCDNGMTMQSYLEMIQTRGVPLPAKLKNIHKHLLTLMLAFNHQARVQCDQVLRVLNSHQSSVVKNTHSLLSNNNSGNQYLRATIEPSPSSRPNRNNPIFHSAVLPSQAVTNINHTQQPVQITYLPRSQSVLSEPKQHINRGTRGMIRSSGISLHNQEKPMKKVYIYQNSIKTDNVELTSVRQIISRRMIGNNQINPKVNNNSPLSKQEIRNFQQSVAQNYRQPHIHIERAAMNRIINQQNPRVNLSQQIKASNILITPNTPKQNITFNKNVQTTQQHVQISHFQPTKSLESENFKHQPQLLKHYFEDTKLIGGFHFTPHTQIHRQSEHYSYSLANDNKIQGLPIGHLQANQNLTLPRHPDLTQPLVPQQNINITRVSQYESQQLAIQRPDLAHNIIPAQFISNQLTMSKAPRNSHEGDLFQKQGSPHTSEGFNQKKEFVPDRVLTNKVPVKPFQTVRGIVNLKPQTASTRNTDSKSIYARPHNQTIKPYLQPQLMLLKPSNVK